MAENYYNRCLATDNDLCLPVIPKEQIDYIFFATEAMVFRLLGEGPRPQSVLDLEHLQVVDYRAFDRVSDEQRAYIGLLHSKEPILPEEMVYLALRSMFGFTWQMPESVDDIRRAAAYEQSLNQVLSSVALDLANKFKASDTLLPYWGRMSFLRTMRLLPTENIEQYRLDQIACVLVKRPKFNATTFALEQNPIIGLNFALEPILKNLNRYLMHFFHSQQMSGAARLSRAWLGITPMILHFWCDGSARKLAGTSILLFDLEAQKQAHALTADQVDFIMMHEIGHVALDHPRRLQLLRVANQDVAAIRHEFEFGADAFAFELLRSKAINDIRYATSADREPQQSKEKESALDALHEYQSSLGAMYLLFTYMDFIGRAGQLMKDRLGERIRFRPQLDSHPNAKARLERLEKAHAGDYHYTSRLLRYAREFFDQVFDYASGLDDDVLFESLKGEG